MNTHFQSPNNVPFQHHNPCNPSKNHPGANKYPTLPPAQNPQCHQQYPHQPNPYNLIGGSSASVPPTYAPLSAYGNTQFLQAQNNQNESFLLNTNMGEVERGLETCFLKFYQIWLGLIIIYCSCLTFLFLRQCVYYSLNPNESFDFVILFYVLWSLIQSVFGVFALREKDLAKAKTTCLMMYIYLIITVVVALMVIFIVYSEPIRGSTFIRDRFVCIFLFGVALHILLHVFVNMRGAFRVRSILSQRLEIKEKFRPDQTQNPFTV